MNIFCSICRELFSPDCKVNSIPCGHLYHASCLDKWCENKSTCPQCRSFIRQRAQQVHFVLKEIPKNQDKSRYEQLLCDYKVIEQEESALRSKLEELKSEELQLNQRITDCKNKVQNSKVDVSIWETQYNIFRPVAGMKLELLQENEEMEKKNKLLDKLDKLINGTDAEMDEILSHLRQTNECTIKELCTLMQAMKCKYDKYKRKFEEHEALAEKYINECDEEEEETQEIEGKTFEDKETQTEEKLTEKKLTEEKPTVKLKELDKASRGRKRVKLLCKLQQEKQRARYEHFLENLGKKSHCSHK